MNTLTKPYTTDTIGKLLPDRLKFFRTRANMTTAEVGAYLDKTSSTVTLWESGKAAPSVETILKICNLYNIADVNELFEAQKPLSQKDLNRTEQNLIKLWRSSKPYVRAAITTLLKECNKK